MNKKLIVFILVVITTIGTNLFAITNAKKIQWLDGTWTGMKYQANMDKAWKLELKIDSKAGSFQINYPDLSCRGRLEFVSIKGKKAIFIEKVNSGLCVDEGYIIITWVNDHLISFTCLRDDRTRLASYCTLEKSGA